MKEIGIPIVVRTHGTFSRCFEMRLEELEIRGRIETIETTALLKSVRILRSLRDLRRLAVIPTPVKDHQLTLAWKPRKREIESLLIAAQNNAIRTNYIKARIDNTQQNSRCRLCGHRDETINHIIREYSKLAQKEYRTRHNWVGKVIHWEMCKKFKFDHTNKWYMHNSAAVLENDTHKLQWTLNIQTDHLISARRPDLIVINNKERKNLQNCGLCCPGRP